MGIFVSHHHVDGSGDQAVNGFILSIAEYGEKGRKLRKPGERAFIKKLEKEEQERKEKN